MGCVLFDGPCYASLAAPGSLWEEWSWSLLSSRGVGHQLGVVSALLGFLFLLKKTLKEGNVVLMSKLFGICCDILVHPAFKLLFGI